MRFPLFEPDRSIAGALEPGPKRWIAFLLAACPLAALLYLVWYYAVDIPFNDQWDIIYLFEKYYSGHLSFADFWQQHNEHRIVFPKLIFLFVGILSRYNVVYEMYLSVLTCFISFLLFIQHMDRNSRILGLGPVRSLLWVLLSCLFFSAVQWENWLWGFQIQWFLNILAVVAGAFIFANASGSPWKMAMLFFCGLVATFSLSSGMLFWPILFILQGLCDFRAYGRVRVRPLVLWLFFFGAVLGMYLIGYHKPPYHPSLMVVVESPLKFFSYVGTYFGRPISIPSLSPYGTILLGLSGLIAFFFLFVRIFRTWPPEALRAWSFFLIIGLYSVLTAALTAVGRAGFGYAQATSSRYTTVALLLWSSLIVMVSAGWGATPSSTSGRNIWHRRAGIIVCLLVAAAVNLNAYKSLGLIQWVSSGRICGRMAVRQGIYPECLQMLYKNPQRLVDFDINRLRRLRISVFRDLDPDPGVTGKNLQGSVSPESPSGRTDGDRSTR
jgi:hypothetical protein